MAGPYASFTSRGSLPLKWCVVGGEKGVMRLSSCVVDKRTGHRNADLAANPERQRSLVERKSCNLDRMHFQKQFHRN
jgi:hypothetical protein